MGALLAVTCRFGGSTAGGGSTPRATVGSGRNAGAKGAGGSGAGGASTLGRGVAARVTCTLASFMLRVSVVTINTTTLVVASTSFERMGY